MRQLLASLFFRLALTYAGLFVGSLMLLCGSFYLLVVVLPLHQTRQIVRREADVLANAYLTGGQAALVGSLAARAKNHGEAEPFHAFIDPHGKVVTSNLPSWPRTRTAPWEYLEADIFVNGDEVDYKALSHDREFDDGARLIVGRDVENISERERVLASGASTVGVAALVLGTLGGLLMSGAVGRRVDRVAATARSVMAGDMSKRVAVDGSGDEFDRLAETLNAMLTRIEDSMEAVRRVSDSVAHELRTPLTRLHASLEDALEARDGQAGHIVEALAEARRLGAIFDTVLRIARIETGRRDIVLSDVDLTALIEDVADFYRPEAEARGIMLTTFAQAGLILRCDRDLIFQAVANLIDNAIKYTPEGGEVVLSARADHGDMLIVVRDTGPGIPEEDLPRVRERFYRASGVKEPGVGLGLSLVDAVARLHRSAVGFRNLAPGLAVEWRFG